MLGAPLRNQNHRDAVLAQRAEQSLRGAGYTDHARALDVDQRHAVDARDPLHRMNRVRRLRNDRSCSVRRERVLDPDRNPLLHRRRHRLRMNDLGAEVGKLHRLVVRERIDDRRIRHAPRIRAEHAIHVRPDHDLFRIEQIAEDRRGEVAAVPAERRLQAFRGARDEAGDDERRVDVLRDHLLPVRA